MGAGQLDDHGLVLLVAARILESSLFHPLLTYLSRLEPYSTSEVVRGIGRKGIFHCVGHMVELLLTSLKITSQLDILAHTCDLSMLGT